MANNKTISSKNKIVQSIDLYANDILNVSRIVGNEDFTSNRSIDLEIATRDKADTKAGNLLLRAGIANSDTDKGNVHIFAGSAEEPSNDGIYVNSDGTIKNFAATSETIQSGTNNNIVLTAAGNKLEVSNDTASANSTKTLVLQAQSALNPNSVTNGITIDRTSGDKIDIKTSALTATAGSTVTIQADTEAANSIKLEKTGNKLTVKNSTASYESASQLTAKTSSNNTVILTEADKKLAVSNAITTVTSGTSITETAPTILLQADAEVSNSIKLEKTNAKLTVKNTTEEHTTADSLQITLPGTSPDPDTKIIARANPDLDQGQHNLEIAAQDIYVNTHSAVVYSDDLIRLDVDTGPGHPAAPNNSIVLDNSRLYTETLKEESHTDQYEVYAAKGMLIRGGTILANDHITTPFEVEVKNSDSSSTDPAKSKATLTVSDLHINNDIKFGGVIGNNQAGRGATVTHVPITGKAGNVDIQQVGSFSLTGQNSSSNPTGQFSLKNASTQEDTSKTKSLLAIQHENVTERAYVNNLDVYGDIRLGTLSNVSTGHPASTSTVSNSNKKLEAVLSEVKVTTSTDFDIDATKIKITGDSVGSTNTLMVSSQGDGISGSGTYATTDKSYIRANAVHVVNDFYGNNVHMYWDADTNSLVFARKTATI